MGTILLATNGSEDAREAAKHAIDLAEDEEATLHVLCVVDEHRFPEPALSSTELSTIYAEEHADISVAEVTEMAEGRDVHVEGDTRHGIPHEVILEYADEVDADTIVIGAHGDHTEHASGVRRKVLEKSEHDVLVEAKE